VWNEDKKHALAGRMDMQKVGMSGHSFGALTTQAVSGQANRWGHQQYLDPRITAALIMSPSVPKQGSPDKAFVGVSIPWMLMTGTLDTSPIGNANVASRLAVYPALPIGGKYELVLFDAEHSAFTDRALPGDTKPRNPNHHKAILALSTAFWDTYLSEQSSAQQWLNGDGPTFLLDDKDSWQKK
jgi:predicted dienelactone hydrolase